MDKILKIDLIDDSEKIEVNLTDYNDTEIKQEIKELQDNQFSGDYNDLTNKPTIPTKTSDLQNDSGFVTSDTEDLENYYKKNEVYNKDETYSKNEIYDKSEVYNKSETYDKTEIDNKVSSVYKYKGSVVTYNDLPSSGLSVGDVYNVEDTGDNYAWTGTAWDKLGGDIDLSDYVKNTDYATTSKGGVIKVGNGIYLDSTGLTRGSVYDSSNYTSKADYTFITKGTLENVLPEKLSTKVDKVEGKGLSTNDYTDEDKEKLAELDEEVETIEGDLYGDITDTTTTGEITIQNSTEGRDLAIDELDGYAEQDSTNGYQLLNIEESEIGAIDASGNLVDNNNNWRGTNYIPVTPNTSYTFSSIGYGSNTYRLRLYEYDENKTFISPRSEGNNNSTLTITTGANTKFLKWTLFIGIVITRQIAEEAKLMLEQGTTAHDWEEFTGGSASPNPDYPQEIKVLTGDNTAHINGGYNLADPQSFEIGKLGLSGEDEDDDKYGRGHGYIEVLPNTTYTLSVNTTIAEIDLRTYTADKSMEFNMVMASNKNKLEITTGANTRYLRWYLKISNSTTMTTGLMNGLNIMIAKGTSTTYIPYVNDQKPINLGDIELCEIGNYRDYIYPNEGKWYKHNDIYEIDKTFIVNHILSVAEITNYVRVAINLTNDYKSISTTNGLCNYFKFEASYSGQSNHFYVQNTQAFIIVDKTLLPTIDTNGVIAFFNSIPNIKIKFVLATPQETEITNTTLISQLNALRKLKQFNNETKITIDDIRRFEISYDGNRIEQIESDLEDKVGFADYATTSVGGVVKMSASLGTSMRASGVVQSSERTYEQYTSDERTLFISKGTLENVVEGKGLVSNTDYASSGTAGVIKIGQGYGCAVNSTGFLNSAIRNYSQYESDSTALFVSKGTLENVVEGKKLTTKPNVDDEIMKNAMPFPNFEDMEKVATYEYDVSDTNYHTIYTIANTGWTEMNMDVLVAYRMTITGTNINQVIDAVDLWHYASFSPITSALSRTLSTAQATSGIRGTRAVYPATSYINDTNYPMAMEFYTYSNDTRRVKIEVFKTNSAVTWANALTNATYSDSTHHGSNAMTYYNMRGWLFRKPASFVATGADVATRVGSYEPYAIGSSSIKTGTSITGNHIAFLADDGVVYDISNTAKNISMGISRVGIIVNSYTSNKALNQSDMRTAVLFTSAQTALIPHATMALGDRLYLRCTMDANGKVHSDNYLDTEMRAGYTWMPFGFATASNALYMDTRNQSFYTLDANGELTHINGLKIAGNMDAFLDNINGEVI